MEQPDSPTAWYFFTDDLPDGEVIVPFRTRYGVAFGVRREAMPEETLKELNRTAQLVLGIGLAEVNTADH
ncbi:hypothetical protein ACIPPM_21930 [Streptomyces sp. NPDC090119]|uniref:hypothetical protein n=1 Tax=Streptomyces sp. NPDC090119 TaxID=3365951 RepID=UPI003823A76C